MSILNKEVLVLNRYWLPIDVVDVRHAVLQMAAGAVQGVDFGQDGYFAPVGWDDWTMLDVREGDDYIKSVNFHMRAPRVVVAAAFGKTIMKRPKLNLKSLAERDNGKCAYTLEELKPHDRTMEHVLPKSRGGETHWENVVLAKKSVNNRRGNKTLEEAGLKLKQRPFTPAPKPFAATIRRVIFPEWEGFLLKGKKHH